MRNKLVWIGTVFTAIYLAGFTWFIFDRLAKLQTMELNNVGDFLAGAFGPIAFFWLILGFMQQGIELRISTDALRLQAHELNSAVEQQKELVSISLRQLDMAKRNTELEHRRLASSIEPKFSMKVTYAGNDSQGDHFHMKLFNGGHSITCISVSLDGVEVLSLGLFGSMMETSFKTHFAGRKHYYSGEVVVSYLNGLEEERYKSFQIELRLDDPGVMWTSLAFPENGSSITKPMRTV